ncbi:MAG: ABC transporter substrate-binding protein [Pseudomonadota bacterium]
MTKRPEHRWQLPRLAAAMTALTLILGGVAAQAQDPVRGGTLVLARSQEPLTLDPNIPADNGSIYAIEQIFDALIEPDREGSGLRPGLAESWEISEDGKVYTLNLREAYFHNGDPVTTEDVVFSLENAKANEGYGFVFAPVETIEAVGDNQIRLTLSEPYAPLLSVLSLFTASIVPKAAYEADPEGFGSMPIGSGPFKVVEYARGERLVLERSDQYWEEGADGDALPYLDRIEMPYVPEGNSRVLGLQSGDFDIIEFVPYSQAATVESDPSLNLEVAPVYRLDYVYLNHAQAPLDNKNIRLALNHATDHDAILNVVFFGYGEVPNGFMPKMNYHSADVPVIPYDIAKAKELVAEAGYDGTPIVLLIAAGDSNGQQIGNILQQGWQQAGLNVSIEQVDGGTAWGMVSDGDYQAHVSYITSDINDDDELATLQADFNSGTEAFFSRYKNDNMGEMLAAARRSNDPEERAKLYGEIQNTVYMDGYSVPLNFSPTLTGSSDKVNDLTTSRTGWWWLKDAWLTE